MGWLKKAAKWVAKKAKAVVRVATRIVMTFVGLVLGVVDLLVGFIGWPPKKLRLHIVILSNQNGPLPGPDPATRQVFDSDLAQAIDFARKTFKARFNVKVLPYGSNMIQILEEPAPKAALNVNCDGGAFGDEFGDAGEFFAQHLAGWNALPISLTFPITVFIVSNVVNKQGCSLGFLTDYITVDLDGVANPSLMAHEILHACNLLGHGGVGQRNLQYAGSNRGDEINAIQKNIFRSSRHVTYW